MIHTQKVATGPRPSLGQNPSSKKQKKKKKTTTNKQTKTRQFLILKFFLKIVAATRNFGQLAVAAWCVQDRPRITPQHNLPCWVRSDPGRVFFFVIFFTIYLIRFISYDFVTLYFLAMHVGLVYNLIGLASQKSHKSSGVRSDPDFPDFGVIISSVFYLFQLKTKLFEAK